MFVSCFELHSNVFKLIYISRYNCLCKMGKVDCLKEISYEADNCGSDSYLNKTGKGENLGIKWTIYFQRPLYLLHRILSWFTTAYVVVYIYSTFFHRKLDGFSAEKYKAQKQLFSIGEFRQFRILWLLSLSAAVILKMKKLLYYPSCT